MGENTKVEWADHTINFWWGCNKKSEGCANCYAESFSKRFGDLWGQNKPRRLIDGAVQMAIRLNAKAEKQGVRYRVFSGSMSDFFETDHGQPIIDGKGDDVFIDDQGLHPMKLTNLREIAFNVIDKTPNLDWLLVTKRPENIRSMWPEGPWSCGTKKEGDQYRTNVWLLTSVENQEQSDKRIPELLKCRDLAPVLGLSCEPLLGPVDLTHRLGTLLPSEHSLEPANWVHQGLDWVICGGESGNKARPMRPEWARSLRDQCQTTGVPFFFKQWGEFLPPCQEQYRLVHFSLPGHWFDADHLSSRVGKKEAGRLLDGVEWNEFPKRMETW